MTSPTPRTYRVQHASVPAERLAAELSKLTSRLRSFAAAETTGWVKDRDAGYLYASGLELAVRLEDSYGNVDAIPARQWRTLDAFRRATILAVDRGVLRRMDAAEIEAAVIDALS